MFAGLTFGFLFGGTGCEPAGLVVCMIWVCRRFCFSLPSDLGCVIRIWYVGGVDCLFVIFLGW